MKANPKAALDALTTPSPLTLGKMALLCRLNSPLLSGDISDMGETLAAIYVVENPVRETVAHFDTLHAEAICFYDGLSVEEYRRKAGAALDAVAAFLEMLPRPAPDAKKNSATDGAPNSPNGAAAPTAGGSTTCSRSCPPSRPRSSGAAGRRDRAEARPARS